MWALRHVRGLEGQKTYVFPFKIETISERNRSHIAGGQNICRKGIVWLGSETNMDKAIPSLRIKFPYYVKRKVGKTSLPIRAGLITWPSEGKCLLATGRIGNRSLTGAGLRELHSFTQSLQEWAEWADWNSLHVEIWEVGRKREFLPNLAHDSYPS